MKNSNFIFDDVTLSPELQIGYHSHQNWELTYIIRGRGVRSIGNLTEPITEKETILIPPGINHVWKFDADEIEVSNISVFFMSSFLKELSSVLPEMFDSIQKLLSKQEAMQFLDEDHDKIESLLLSMRGVNPEGRLPKMIELISLISNSMNHRFAGSENCLTRSEKRLDKIRIYLTCNYNRAISLDDVASHMRMHKTSLCTFMRKYTGMTLSEYLNTIRLRVASERILNSDEKISTIAYEVGYSDITYFNRLFKRKYGISPSQYKKINSVHCK